jgi:EAL and modified HD-GYP domain-containing signal transduction protein
MDIQFLRIPILDKKKKLFGQRIKLKNKNSITLSELEEFLNNIKQKKYTFINISEDLLENQDILSLLNKENTIIFTSKIIDDFKIATYTDAPNNVLEKADFIFIKDISEIDKVKNYKGKLIYENVKTIEEFNKLKDIEDISYFEGYFFTKVKVVKNKNLKTSKLELISLFNLAVEDFDINKIEEFIKRNPDLSLQLLRYVNSALFSLRSRITSIKHAISILGQERFTNWVLLQLYYSEDYTENPLLETVAIRGKTLEILAEKIGENKEEGFLVGILSLVDILLETHIEEILEQIEVNENIKNSLINNDTKLGKLLKIVKKLEEDDLTSAEELSNELGLKINDVMQAELQAIIWYNLIPSI